ncbi:iron-containing alcohol dehydrogenase family protein [Bifidobacterium pseudolongum]|uniref:iron-containing alcohol dehydrogenase family protein n=1 Tax=Bifidobacterium pseudolongum TaxID=1694 RepID=UPI000AB5003E|nr:iron-containing alcohol dehydrogenase family protein [Bifidobacterium pseudolongum]UNP91853.1 iron-containing alcohol dehydrogenase family protein [Bifidobacterium pseudolongum subsp. pseudolongum]WCA40423.1 iron-containing alcohol dehydrogenase family protein [Bifidobacterium pseudolongum subsp. pseudolongum]
MAIGAGKLADTAKNVAELLNVDLVMVPTLACACAAYTPFSVNYDDEHRYVGSPLHGRNSVAMIVDSALISRAPAEKMVGGIGDTIAKWYECAPVLERANDLSAFDQLAYQSARLIHDILLEHSEDALKALRAGDYDNEQVRLLIDTIIGLAGTIGGLGCERARVSGAHALHNGLTQVPGSAATMHGDKVAYGVLVQLVAEGKEAEARQLLAYYDSVGLPHSWKQMNIEFTDENLWTVAEYTTQPDSTFLSAVPNATPQMLVDAMRVVEEFPAEAA